MTYDERHTYIIELKNYINKLTNEKPIIKFVENGKKLCGCGEKIWKTSNKCNTCAHIDQRKVERPDIESLKKEVKEIGYCACGRKYGVSDASIRKWIKN